MKPHQLALLPPNIDYSTFLEHLTTAHRALSRLDTLLKQTQNPRIFERSFMTKEAVLSSRIEGTMASIDEVLGFDAGAEMINESLHDDAVEITNYRKALEQGMSLLLEEPLGENTLKELHHTLLSKGRGANRGPGEFRKTQVYIARTGKSIHDASYIPPEAQMIPKLTQNLLHYIHDGNERDDLVCIAVAHYQFEAIHPFLDGNGRVGRLLISLLLHDKKLLELPYLYLSEYFEENRQDYYEGLRNVSDKNSWTEWIKFFLSGITQQATSAAATVLETAELYRGLQEKFAKISPEYGLLLLDALFQRPVFTVSMLREQMNQTNVQTSYTLVEKLLGSGIIRDLTPSKQRGKRYEFIELLKIVHSNN